MKKVFKYGTGMEVPVGAIYLKTVKQEKIYAKISENNHDWVPCWLVWHYFLVEVKE